MNGEIFEAGVDGESEGKSEEAEEKAEEEKGVAVGAEEFDLGKVRELQTSFAAGFLGASGGRGEKRESGGDGAKFGESQTLGPGIR